MRVTKCDRCGCEYDPKDLEKVKVGEMEVDRIRIGTTKGISDSTDLCQSCLKSFERWFKYFDYPEREK